MRFLFPFILLIFVNGVAAQESELALVMKEMAFSYKQARKAQSTEDLLIHLQEIENALVKSKEIGFKRKQAESTKGIDKVLTLVKEIQKNANDLSLAQEKLVKIDQLRKQYHEIHEPSFWQLLFGH